jgi:hypothetical protein
VAGAAPKGPRGRGVPPRPAIPCVPWARVTTGGGASNAVAAYSRPRTGPSAPYPPRPRLSQGHVVWVQNSYLGATEVENRRQSRPVTESAPRRARATASRHSRERTLAPEVRLPACTAQTPALPGSGKCEPVCSTSVAGLPNPSIGREGTSVA